MTIDTIPIRFAHVDREDGSILAVFDTAQEASDALVLLGPLAEVEVDAIFPQTAQERAESIHAYMRETASMWFGRQLALTVYKAQDQFPWQMTETLHGSAPDLQAWGEKKLADGYVLDRPWSDDEDED